MISRSQFGVVALALLASVSAQARLTQCRPAADCAAGDKPCTNWINEGATESLTPSPAAGAGVIRVRVCTAGDPVCTEQGGPNQQTVSVWGYAGAQEVYSMVLSTAGTRDTGPYTKLAGLSRLAVRCNSSTTTSCKIIWQVCREELPVQTRPKEGR